MLWGCFTTCDIMKQERLVIVRVKNNGIEKMFVILLGC